MKRKKSKNTCGKVGLEGQTLKMDISAQREEAEGKKYKSLKIKEII